MSQVVIGLSAVIVAVTDEQPRVLTVNPAEHALATRDLAIASEGSFSGLPFGPLDPSGDRTLELGLRSWVRQQTGLELGYAEQLYTFGDRDRLASLGADSPRVISVAYLALVRESDAVRGAARWHNVYEFFPWEDRRDARVRSLPESFQKGLGRWAGGAADPAARSARRERIDLCFGLHGATWDPDRVLDRYELLYESGEIAGREDSPLGEPMALDHRRILATALGRLRGKIRYRPVVFELLPATFTLFQLQRLVESLAGFRLHKQNFRRLVSSAGLVEGTGRFEKHTGGRPAELFRFRREVLRERLAPGVGRPNPVSGP